MKFLWRKKLKDKRSTKSFHFYEKDNPYPHIIPSEWHLNLSNFLEYDIWAVDDEYKLYLILDSSYTGEICAYRIHYLDISRFALQFGYMLFKIFKS